MKRRRVRSVGAFEAKTHFSRLLQRVAAGERITITRHGRPVAMLGPVGGEDRPGVDEAIRAIREFRRGRRLGVPARTLIDEGRRF